MEEQEKQVPGEDVEAHIRKIHGLQDEGEPTDEHGKRSLSGDDDDDVEAHIAKFHH
ncbi:MAG TPA: hypothetical protein VFP55_00085 [Solirubrobacteraceae bacterium]|nr:hypothetical protein [Solirubrobacteraceae bacterium]